MIIAGGPKEMPCSRQVACPSSPQQWVGMAESGRAHHEEEGIGLRKQGQQVGGGVLVVQHLHLQLPRMRRCLPPHRCIPHLQHTLRVLQTQHGAR